MADYYDILGVAADADADAIKKAYREQARKHHPDLNPDDPQAEETFKQVSEAYAVLSDSKKRAEYDQMRRLGAVGGGPGAPGGFGGPGGFSFRVEDLFGPGGPEGLFEEVFGMGGLGGRARAAGPRRRRGRDVEAPLRIPFRLAMSGGPHHVRLPVPNACERCGGSGTTGGGARCATCEGQGVLNEARGSLQFSRTCPDCGGSGQQPGPPCPRCGGSGVEQQRQELSVKIPPGVDEGTRLRLKGKGYPGSHGGPPGDLFLRLSVEPDPQLRRDGRHIVVKLPLRASEAAAGATVEVPTIEGHSMLKVPPGTQSGQRLRMRGKGVPQAGGGRGDQLVEVQIHLPSLDEAQIERLRAWEGDFDPRA